LRRTHLHLDSGPGDDVPDADPAGCAQVAPSHLAGVLHGLGRGHPQEVEMSTRTTTHLRNEHESARNLLGAFSRYLDDVEARGIPDSRESKQFIDYLGETF